MHSIFWEKPIVPAKRVEQRKKVFDQRPDVFGSVDEAGAFLERVDVPASLRWALAINPKCGNTSVKRFLFHLEYGCELSADYTSVFDINSDGPAQRLSVAGVYRNLSMIDGADTILQKALRITTSRHPVSRAVSMFNYLCRSNINGHAFFVDQRLRINAAVGFDWKSDVNTPAGFDKFLRYMELCYAESAVSEIDFHWRRQVDTVRPDYFKPDIIGDVDRLAVFYAQVAARLSTGLAIKTDRAASNQFASTDAVDRVLTPAALDRIVKVYEADFTWLGVQPDGWRRDTAAPRPARWRGLRFLGNLDKGNIPP